MTTCIGNVRRLVLATLAVGIGVTGLWAWLAPESFYNDFVFGRGWVRLDGAYNEHLIRDVGALNLALAVVTAVAAYQPGRRLVRLVAAATLAFSVPHLAYHATAMERFAPGDIAAQYVLLILQVALPLWLVVSPGPEPEPSSAMTVKRLSHTCRQPPIRR